MIRMVDNIMILEVRQEYLGRLLKSTAIVEGAI